MLNVAAPKVPLLLREITPMDLLMTIVEISKIEVFISWLYRRLGMMVSGGQVTRGHEGDED